MKLMARYEDNYFDLLLLTRLMGLMTSLKYKQMLTKKKILQKILELTKYQGFEWDSQTPSLRILE